MKGELVWVVIKYPVSQIKRSHEKKSTNRKPYRTHMIRTNKTLTPRFERERETEDDNRQVS
jgi:hypothetical protein